jgi:uncharacterized membrane protein
MDTYTLFLTKRNNSGDRETSRNLNIESNSRLKTLRYHRRFLFSNTLGVILLIGTSLTQALHKLPSEPLISFEVYYGYFTLLTLAQLIGCVWMLLKLYRRTVKGRSCWLCSDFTHTFLIAAATFGFGFQMVFRLQDKYSNFGIVYLSLAFTQMAVQGALRIRIRAFRLKASHHEKWLAFLIMWGAISFMIISYTDEINEVNVGGTSPEISTILQNIIRPLLLLFDFHSSLEFLQFVLYNNDNDNNDDSDDDRAQRNNQGTTCGIYCKDVNIGQTFVLSVIFSALIWSTTEIAMSRQFDLVPNEQPRTITINLWMIFEMVRDCIIFLIALALIVEHWSREITTSKFHSDQFYKWLLLSLCGLFYNAFVLVSVFFSVNHILVAVLFVALVAIGATTFASFYLNEVRFVQSRLWVLLAGVLSGLHLSQLATTIYIFSLQGSVPHLFESVSVLFFPFLLEYHFTIQEIFAHVIYNDSDADTHLNDDDDDR